MKNINIKKLSVLLPYYHEGEKNLFSGIKKIKFFLEKKKIPYEIIISQNGSAKKINLPDDPSLKLVFDKKRGLGRALKNTLPFICGDYCYFSSCEFPFDLSDLQNLLKLNRDYDLVIGSKLHQDSIYQISYYRKFISILFSYFSSLVLPKFSIKDPNGTLFAKTMWFKKLASKVKSDDFFFEIELVFRFFNNNLKIVEVPVIYIKKNVHSSVNISDGLKYLWQLLLLHRRI